MKSNRLANCSLYYAISIFAITFTIASPIIIEIGGSASQDISNMGLLMTLFSTGFVTGSLLTSILTRFFHKSLILNIAMLIQTIFILIFGFSISFTPMLLIYFVIGMCGGFIETLVSLILPEINKGESGYYMNISQVFFGIGAFAGPYISSLIINAGFNWKFSYFLLAFLAFLNFLFFSILRIKYKNKYFSNNKNITVELKNNESKSKIGNSTDGIENSAIKIFILLSFAMILYVASEDGLNAWIPTFFRMEKNYSPYQASQVLSFYWLAMAVGRLLIGLLSKKINLMLLTIVISIGGFLFTLAGILVHNRYLNLIFFIMIGLFFSGIWPNIVALSMEYLKYDKRRDTFVSLIISFGGIGALMAPWIVGRIFKVSNLFIGLLSCALFMLIEIILLLFLQRSLRLKNIN